MSVRESLCVCVFARLIVYCSNFTPRAFNHHRYITPFSIAYLVFSVAVGYYKTFAMLSGLVGSKQSKKWKVCCADSAFYTNLLAALHQQSVKSYAPNTETKRDHAYLHTRTHRSRKRQELWWLMGRARNAGCAAACHGQ